MFIFACIVAALLLFFVYLINKTLVASVEKIAHPQGLIKHVQHIDDAGFTAQANTLATWAKQHDFEHDSYVLAHTLIDGSALQCSVWWSQTQATWVLLYYYKGKYFYDFVSKLANNGIISTVSGKDGLTLPPAGKNRIQAFPQLSLDELLQKHLATQAQFNAKVGLAIQRNKTDVVQELENALGQQAEYVKTIPLWKFKGVFWYFVRRNWLVNKPIEV
ncbi:MAG TPA: hypothetical protein PL131_00340 [Methylotenera sp.]|mgnify:CR=1 FL=1|nr:hypothetical protein [Methylotenera sp.]HPH04294.1 hypothetical protein [Methylotenera sp.]HPM99848.1 hypothetical protein [Methylotenera sp.]